jgi:type II secretory pathway pseudopilin PulG
MTRKEAGFTLVELIIVCLMTGLIIAAAASSFSGLLSQSRTQGKITEANENLVGLELMRRDIETAGYGLFWDSPTAVAYTTESTYPNAAGFAGVFNEPTTSAPRAIIGSNATVFAGADSMFNLSSYLVIKSMSVARNPAGDKWTSVIAGPSARQWFPSFVGQGDEIGNNDRVIVVNPRDKTSRPLVTGAASFYTTYGYNTGALPNTDSIADATMAPLSVANGGAANDVYTVYGINSPMENGVAQPLPARPFNRADYFISRTALPAAPLPGNFTVPTRCAPNTGVLYKAVMNHTGAGLAAFTYEPLLDCVADMQVFFAIDADNNGSFLNGVGNDGYCQNLIAGPCPVAVPLTAAQTRTQVKEVRVYVLTHEGRLDPSFTYPSATIQVGDLALPPLGMAHPYILTANMMNYRWKVYQLIVKPYNLLN